jgi:transposase InsO family protein
MRHQPSLHEHALGQRSSAACLLVPTQQRHDAPLRRSRGRPPSGGPDRAAAHNTYVPTWSGMAFTAFVSDVFSRRIVGWRTAAAMPTELPLDALEMALWTRARAGQTVDGLVHHTDRGSKPRSATRPGCSTPARWPRSARSATATTTPSPSP